MSATVLCIVTGGSGDLLRAKHLCAGLKADITYFSVDKALSRLNEARQIAALLRSKHWDLVYLEGTGISGGLNLIQAAKARRQKFILSSGDPIGGFFRVTRGPFYGSVFERYERSLYRRCAAFVGWTPYLTGMALSMGAPRGVTIEGGADLTAFRPFASEARAKARVRFGLAPDHVVCGVVGSLNWTKRQSYSYGLELVEAIQRSKRNDVSALIVGDGNGRHRLEEKVPASFRSRIIFTGRLSADDVPEAINAMNIGFITQTLDGLGNFRLTTKLPEYLACGVPVAMSPIPGFYDYVYPPGWALPAMHPAHPDFHAACANWLDGLSHDEITFRASLARPRAEERFDYEHLSQKFALFVADLLGEKIIPHSLTSSQVQTSGPSRPTFDRTELERKPAQS